MVQSTLAPSSAQASGGTSPSCAAKAIGMPKPNAMPSHACGIAEEALGERIDRGQRERHDGELDRERVQLAAPSRTRRAPARAATASASQGRIAPVASGRFFVRSTCASNLRSAKSLMRAARRAHQHRADDEDPQHRPARHAAAREPQAPERGPEQQQDADRLVEADQLLVGIEALRGPRSSPQLQDRGQEDFGHHQRPAALA